VSKISIIPPVARRYASAFLACTSTPKMISEVQKELKLIEHCCAQPSFAKFLRSPLVSVSEQEAVMKALVKRLDLSKLTGNFLGVIVQKRRLPFLPAMIQAYEDCVAQAEGVTRADVVTAQPLSAALKAQVEALLGAEKKKHIHIAEHVDPSILGGIVVTVGNRLFDASLRTQLKNMYFAMKGVS
jgi:F-type H+-transporting ATPase subunit delta